MPSARHVGEDDSQDYQIPEDDITEDLTFIKSSTYLSIYDHKLRTIWDSHRFIDAGIKSAKTKITDTIAKLQESVGWYGMDAAQLELLLDMILERKLGLLL